MTTSIDPLSGQVHDWLAALSRALDLLERHQFCDDTIWNARCKHCSKWSRDGHKPDCELALLLKENGREVRFAEPQPDKETT
jgi:hypothetical protein